MKNRENRRENERGAEHKNKVFLYNDDESVSTDLKIEIRPYNTRRKKKGLQNTEGSKEEKEKMAMIKALR